MFEIERLEAVVAPISLGGVWRTVKSEAKDFARGFWHGWNSF